jgi:hypothetical protein
VAEQSEGLRLADGVTLMQDLVAGPIGGPLFALAVAIPFLVNAGTCAASAGTADRLAARDDRLSPPGHRWARAA